MKKLSVALATATAAAMLMVGAAPAVAAGNSIDPGDSLYAVNCDTEYFNWQLLSVDPTTAFSTKIGDGEGYSETYFACAGQPAYNVVTGRSYYIQWQYGEGAAFFLAEMDVATGNSTEIGEFSAEGDGTYYPEVESIAIGVDGLAFALAEGDLYSLDLGTGDLTLIDSSLVATYAFAVDPTTGLFYAIDDDNELFLVDTVDGSYVNIGTVGTADTVYSLQIDGGGMFWVEADEESDSGAGLWSFTLDTYGTPVYSGPFIDGPFYTEAILIIPGEPALAATGADNASVPLIAGGAIALALLGLAFVVSRRRTA